MATLRLVPASGPPIEITKDPTVVGRDPGCDVVLPDGSVSRRHARFEKRGSDWAVVDQGSANGTFLDSQRVAEVPLRHGQELRFGALSFRVELAGAEDMAVTMPGVGAPEATVVSPTPLTPAPPPPRAGAPPALPKPPAARPSPPPPPSAAARERFHPPSGPSAPSPVPQMPSGPAPAKKGKGPVFWIVTGCCGCLFLGLALAALLGGGLFFMTKGAADAVHAFVTDVKAGNLEKAHEGLSESYKARMSQSQLERLVARHPGLKDNADATFWKRSVENDIATLTGVLTPTAGKPEPVTFKLMKEGGAWKISDIQFVEEGDSSSSAAPSEGSPPDESGHMQVETMELNKEPAGSGTKVTIKTRARGFGLRREGLAYRIDLLGDLETLGPSGRIDSLSKDGFYALRETTASPDGAYADFRTDLTFAQAPPGGYTVRVTIRDQIGGGRKTHLVTFSLP